MYRYMDNMAELGRVDRENELWMQRQYERIQQEKQPGYSLVSIRLKNFLEYRHLIGHEKSEEAVLACFNILAGCLSEGEYIVRIHSWCFNLLIHCPADEEHLHPCASRFHFAVRDGMETLFGRNLYLEIGFYPMIDPAVDFYCAQYYADLCRFGPHQPYPETNYDMYYVSFQDQKENFRKYENMVSAALEHRDFKLYLQPKVNARTGEVCSAEALMRWIDPQQGMIPLSVFLPYLEENGFIRNVDLYLFDTACSYLEKWRHNFHKDIQISFNLSGAYFNGPYFLPEYKEAFEKYDIPAGCICIELLESIVLNEMERLQPLVDGIYDLGFQCALDDFGSGFSSFDILTNTRLSELKIDRSLFQNIDNPKERNLLKHLVDISHDFGMVTVAEGIETPEYAAYMKEIGCDFIQGFYYYRPMPVEEFEERFVRGNEPNKAKDK